MGLQTSIITFSVLFGMLLGIGIGLAVGINTVTYSEPSLSPTQDLIKLECYYPPIN